MYSSLLTLQTARRFSTLFIAFSFLLQAPPTFGQKNWVGGTGNWDNASNWDPAGVPTTSDDVIIATGDDVTIPAMFNAVAKSAYLLDGGKLKVSATAGLTIDNASEDGISVYNSGSIVNNFGNITIGNTSINRFGARLFSGGNFNNFSSGSITINNAINNSALSIEYGSTLTNNGNLNIGNSTSPLNNNCVGLWFGAHLINGMGASIQLNFANGYGIYMTGSNTSVANDGQIKIGNLGGLGYGGIYQAEGIFANNSNGLLEISNIPNYDGIFVANSNTVFSNSGIIKIGVAGGIKKNGVKLYQGCSFTNAAGGLIEINNITLEDGIQMNEAANFTNNGILKIGNIAPINRVGVLIFYGTFTNGANALLEINRTTTGNGLETQSNSTLFTNNGTIKIGNVANILGAGLLVYGGSDFINGANSILEISNTQTNNGLNVSLAGSTFTNSGTIKISNPYVSTCAALFDGGQLTNMANGLMELNNAPNGYGIYLNANSSNSFSNAGQVKIGNSQSLAAGIRQDGGNFNNQLGGILDIDKISGFDGILLQNSNPVFSNAGTLKIGNNDPIKRIGINLLGNSSFSNSASASIEVNQVISTLGNEGYGIRTSSGATFTNNGNIQIGNILPVSRKGIFMSGGTFSNNPGAALTVQHIPNYDGIDMASTGVVFFNDVGAVLSFQ